MVDGGRRVDKPALMVIVRVISMVEHLIDDVSRLTLPLGRKEDSCWMDDWREEGTLPVEDIRATLANGLVAGTELRECSLRSVSASSFDRRADLVPPRATQA